MSKLFIRDNFKWKANKGDRIYFWEDIWVRDTALKTVYPRLYRVNKHKHIFVQEMIALWHNYPNTSQQLWFRTLHTQESVDALKIYNIIQAFNPSFAHDTLVWKQTNKAYTTKDMYQLLGSDSFPHFK